MYKLLSIDKIADRNNHVIKFVNTNNSEDIKKVWVIEPYTDLFFIKKAFEEAKLVKKPKKLYTVGYYSAFHMLSENDRVKAMETSFHFKRVKSNIQITSLLLREIKQCKKYDYEIDTFEITVEELDVVIAKVNEIIVQESLNDLGLHCIINYYINNHEPFGHIIDTGRSYKEINARNK